MTKDFHPFHEKARAHASKGEIGLAVHQLKQAIAIAPDEPALYEDLFKWCMVAGVPRAAISAAFELRRIQPLSANFVYMHGIATLSDGQVPEARRILEQALAMAPDSWQVRQALAQVLQILKEDLRARELLEEAVDSAPEAPGPANDLALMALKRGDLPQAVRVLRRVLAAHPEDAGTHLNLALALVDSDPAASTEHARHAAAGGDADIRDQAQRLLAKLS